MMDESEDKRVACRDCGFETDSQYLAKTVSGRLVCAACYQVYQVALSNAAADAFADRLEVLSWAQSVDMDDIEVIEADRPFLYRGLLNYLRCL